MYANVTGGSKLKGKQRLYIAYGSNLNLEQMAFRCPTAKVVGKSELKDYELLFRGGRRGAVVPFLFLHQPSGREKL